MTGLPSSWAVAPLENLIAPNGIFTDGDWVESKDQDPNGEVRLIQLADIADSRFVDKSSRFLTRQKADELNCTFLENGDLLVARMPDPLGRCCIFPLDGEECFVTVVDVCAIRVGSAEIDPQYLMRAINSPTVRAQVSALQSGSTRKRISRKNLATVSIPVPPFNEQYRIVEKIEALFDEIDRGVESLRTARSTIDLYRQSLLKSAFEGRLTAGWRAENQDRLESPDALVARIWHEREQRYQTALDGWQRSVAEWKKAGEKGRRLAKPKQVKGFDLLPSSDRLPWPVVRVEALLDAPLVNGRSAKDKAGGFPVLRLTALKNGKIDLWESKEGDWSRDDAEPFFVERDDIFVARGNGSKKLVGIGGRVLDDPAPIAFPDTMIRVRLDTSAVRPEYFVLVWNSWAVRRQIEMAARTTAGIYKINQGHIRGFVLPLPSLAEQSEIVRILEERLESTDALQAEIDANLARAEALRQSILKRAFSGQLVSQDPADEPAQALLARIHASRDQGSATKPRRPTHGRASTPAPP